MNDTDLEAIAARRWRVSLILTAILLVVYFGFLLLVAFNKALLATLVAPGLSWGILGGAVVIVVAWLLTGYYVSWANQHHDPAIARLLRQSGAHSVSEQEEAQP